MNLPQRIIIFLGLLVVAGFCLRPPYVWEHTTYLINLDSGVPHQAGTNTTNAGHCWIWSPPQGTQKESDDQRTSQTANIDWSRLGIYVGLTLAVTLAGAFVAFGNRKKPDK
jgi:hypothetical protein